MTELVEVAEFHCPVCNHGFYLEGLAKGSPYWALCGQCGVEYQHTKDKQIARAELDALQGAPSYSFKASLLL